MHIAACLSLFDELRPLFVEPDEAEWALWLHDVVYNTQAHDNEQQSAQYAEHLLRSGGAYEAAIQRIVTLILATQHSSVVTSGDAALVVDIDLSILGSPPSTFDSYEHAIRSEYAWVPEDVFREKRAEILRGFLQRERIYNTDVCHRRFNAQAHDNLQRSLRRLAQ